MSTRGRSQLGIGNYFQIGFLLLRHVYARLLLVPRVQNNINSAHCIPAIHLMWGQCNGDGTRVCTKPFPSSPVMQWAVLINTNAWYGCEELKSRSRGRVGNATNFVNRRRSRRAYVQGTFWCEQKAPLFTAFTDPLWLLDLERSQKVDLGTYRFQEPIRSLSLEGKGLRRAPIGVITIIYLVN